MYTSITYKNDVLNVQKQKEHEIMLVKKKGTSWTKLIKQCKDAIKASKKITKLGELLEKQKHKKNTVFVHVRKLQAKTLQTDMYKYRSKNRYYLFEGRLHTKIKGKIPARHQPGKR